MSSSILLVDVSLVNLTFFELATECPYLLIPPFTDTASVDTFLTNNISILIPPILTHIGCLNIFPSKSILDYFEQQITLLYPNISHIDILDKNSNTLQHNDIKEKANIEYDLALSLADYASSSKINFHTLTFGEKNSQTYFSTPLRTLFNYVPLVFPTAKPNCTNIMLIDSTIPDAQVFYDAANTTTLPVLFNSNTLRGEIFNLLATHTTINRLCVVATNRSMYNNTKLFINNETYFNVDDVTAHSSATYSNNVQFMIDLIQSYNIKTIDFLACESLNYTPWQNYYSLLQDHGCTIGASSDKTGNLAYGGNWIMESDDQNIQSVYFTNEIVDYTTTLDTPVVNIVFGTYDPSNGNTTYYVTSPYDISSNLYTNTTYAIYNSTADPVTIYLAEATAELTYNIEINIVPIGYAGNGSNVTIDGSGVAIAPSPTLFNETSLVTVIDTPAPLTNISIQNINVDVTENPDLTGSSNGWILHGELQNASTVDVSNCSVYSTSGDLTIGRGDFYNGGIAGGHNNNGASLTFTSCSVYSMSGDLTIGGGGYYSGGITGGHNNNGASLTFTSCSVYSTSGDLTISITGICNGGIAGGHNNNGASLTFTSCSVYSTSGDLTINDVSGNSNAGICGGDNDSASLTFTSCLVYSTSGNLTICGGGGGDNNGGIAGGGNYNSASLTFTSCLVYSTSGNLTICGGGGNYTGGIAGGYNYDNSSLTFTSCSVYSTSGNLTISGGGGGGDLNGGIGGGGNYGSSLTFTSCLVYSSGTLTISDGGYYNAGIGGGSNYDGASLTFTSCLVYSSGDLTVGGGPGNLNGGIAGGFNNGASLTFTSCSVYSSGTLTISSGGGSNGGIAGGFNNGSSLTFTSCFVYSTNGDLTISITNSDYIGGICGGFNNNNTSLIFISCSVYSTNGDLTISAGGGDSNGGIGGGGNFNNTSLTITSCSVYSTSGDLTINGINGYSNGGIGGGSNNGSSLIFTSCSVYSSENLTISSSNGYYNGGISGGGNTNNNTSLIFTSCSVYSSGDLTIDSSVGQYNAGICGGNNTFGTSLTFSTCTINSTTSIILNNAITYDSSFCYISDLADPTTTPPTLADNGIICGDAGESFVSYPSKSVLIVVTPADYVNVLFPPNSELPLDATFVGQNLSGMDLSGVNFSYYDLSGTILPGNSLPYGSSNYIGALITDCGAIATNIVMNNSGQPLSFDNTLTYSAINMNDGGMIALVNGINTLNNNLSAALSVFVSGLYDIAIQIYTPNKINGIFVPVSTLPSVNPWRKPITNSSIVQLINASLYPNTIVDLATLSFSTAPYYYILVQNYPDSVTIKSGTHTLLFYAMQPFNSVLNDVSFNYSIDGSPPLGPIFVGSAINFDDYTFYVDSLGFLLQKNPVSTICFPAGTPIRTDQGSVPIDKIDTTYHTINYQPIEHITQTITNDTYLICFEKHALGPNYPSRQTVMSKDHNIYYKRKKVPAYNFLALSDGVRKVRYSGELLYNVLLSETSTMYVNNLLCETLDPANIIAKLYMSTYSQYYKHNIAYLMNESFRKRDMYAYKKIVSRLM